MVMEVKCCHLSWDLCILDALHSRNHLPPQAQSLEAPPAAGHRAWATQYPCPHLLQPELARADPGHGGQPVLPVTSRLSPKPCTRPPPQQPAQHRVSAPPRRQKRTAHSQGHRRCHCPSRLSQGGKTYQLIDWFPHHCAPLPQRQQPSPSLSRSLATCLPPSSPPRKACPMQSLGHGKGEPR